MGPPALRRHAMEAMGADRQNGENPPVVHFDGRMPIGIVADARNDGLDAEFAVPEPPVVGAGIADRGKRQ